MSENKQPRNLFEQILFGVEATNQNIVSMSEDMSAMFQKIDTMTAKVDEMYNLLFPKTEPNPSGAEEEETIGGENIKP